MNFIHTKAEVFNRGPAPDSFLATLVNWGKAADPAIFAPNEADDIYGATWAQLGPRTELLQWRAWMLEMMRVHAGMESSWNWKEGVDMNNAHSQAHIEGQETGIFQVSHDSLRLDKSGGLNAFCVSHLGSHYDTRRFIDVMKFDQNFALEYYARLVRVSIRWAGPLILDHDNKRSIYPWLSRAAMREFEELLKA